MEDDVNSYRTMVMDAAGNGAGNKVVLFKCDWYDIERETKN